MGMLISDLHPVDRPRERLASRGPAALSEDELLAAVLRTGYAGKCALEVASGLLRLHPNGGLSRIPWRELSALKGMGPSRAAALAAALELGRRWSQPPPPGGLDTPAQAYAVLSDIGRARREHFVALYLNARNQLLSRETVSIGTLTASLVHPR